MPQYINHNKSYSVAKEPGGSYIGIVTAVDNGVYVEVPKVVPGHAFGPCSTAGVFSLSLTKETVTTPTGTVEAVTDVVLSTGGTTPNVGDQVVCMFLDNQFSELIVVGIIGQP